MARVRVFCGPPRGDGRENAINALLRECWGHGVLLVPTRQYASRRAERLILDSAETSMPGAWGRPVQTFQDFALSLVKMPGAPLVDDLERRHLLEGVLDELRSRDALEAVGAAADTYGFASHILRVINQLKQAAVEPDAFRQSLARRRSPSRLDPVVAEIYAAYQHALIDASVYDLPGLYWQAALECRQKKPAALDGIRLLALDGFADFTPSEFRLIEAVETHVDLLVFGISHDLAAPGRRDVYALPARTLRQLQARFAVEITHFPEAQPASFVEFAAMHIFWRDKPPSPENQHPNIEVLSCAGMIHEIEVIARRIKSLLLDDGVALDDIALVLRDLRDTASAIRSVFGEYGVPLRMSARPALSESAIGAFLSHFLEAVEGFDRDTVAEIVASPWFRPRGDGEAPLPCVHLLSRTAQIVEGFDEWMDGLKSLTRRLDNRDDETTRRLHQQMPNACEQAKGVRARVQSIRQIGRILPEKGRLEEFLQHFDDLIERCGIEKALDDCTSSAIQNPEKSALLALRGLLNRWHAWVASHPSDNTLTRAAFSAQLRQALRDARYDFPQPGVGVACLDVEGLRHLQFDYVFLANANEGAMPKPRATGAIYSEDDLDDLRAVGIDIEDKGVRNARELLLFDHVLEAAQKRLYITYRTLSRTGGELLPSPYVTDLRELFPEAALRRSLVGAADFAPESGAVASRRDLRNAGISDKALRGMFPEEFKNVLHGSDMERRRHAGTTYDHYDGLITASELKADLARRFDSEHQFSVAQLETYAACHFQFFVGQLLGIEEAEIPASEFDPRLRGTILHSILQAFHEKYRGRSLAEIDEQEAKDALQELTQSIFEEKAWRSAAAPKAVIEVEQIRMERLLERYVHIERERDGEDAWKPTHFEVAFGRVPRPSSDLLSTAAPFKLETLGGVVLLGGRIDRIDRSGESVRIIDYKASINVSAGDIDEGHSLQLPVYALAVEGFLMTGSTCAEAWFLSPGKGKRQESLNVKKVKWDDRRDATRKRVADLIALLRAGYFPPTPTKKACEYCGARSVCRFETARIERKLEAAKKAENSCP